MDEPLGASASKLQSRLDQVLDTHRKRDASSFFQATAPLQWSAASLPHPGAQAGEIVYCVPGTRDQVACVIPRNSFDEYDGGRKERDLDERNGEKRDTPRCGGTDRSETAPADGFAHKRDRTGHPDEVTDPSPWNQGPPGNGRSRPCERDPLGGVGRASSRARDKHLIAHTPDGIRYCAPEDPTALDLASLLFEADFLLI